MRVWSKGWPTHAEVIEAHDRSNETGKRDEIEAVSRKLGAVHGLFSDGNWGKLKRHIRSPERAV
ncbi:hypothetical protein PRJ_5685 (plasmid) [Pseudomonas sp. XWY-1]|nr:hypothetical protein PRJ_5685 [Pseudomonas sp. XWY-1]